MVVVVLRKGARDTILLSCDNDVVLRTKEQRAEERTQ